MNTTVVKPPRIPLFHQSLCNAQSETLNVECPFCWGGIIPPNQGGIYSHGHCFQCGVDVVFLDVDPAVNYFRYLQPPFPVPPPLQLPVHTVELERHKHTLQIYGTDGDVPFVILKDPESGQVENITFPRLAGYEIFSAMAKRDSVNIVFRKFPVTL